MGETAIRWLGPSSQFQCPSRTSQNRPASIISGHLLNMSINPESKTTVFVGQYSHLQCTYVLLFLTDGLLLSLPGGLDQEVTEKLLYSAFIPFGDIISVQIPPDPSSSIYSGMLYYT
jgi:RNA recognition motif-containing protein